MSTLRSPQKKTEQKRKRTFWFVVFLVLFAALFAGFVWSMSRPAFQIQAVNVQGAEVLDPNEIKSIVQKNLSGKYFYLFPRSNIFFYPKAAMEKELFADYPRIKNLSVSLNEERNLDVLLSERSPDTLWCGVQKLADKAANACYYMDDTGFVFGKAPTFSGHAYFEFYGKGQLPEQPLGHFFTSPERLQKIKTLRESLVKSDQKVVDAIFADDGTAELTALRGCGIRFDLNQDISQLSLNMEAVFMSHDWGKGIKTSDGENRCTLLEYVDFRFGNKIYYKERGKGAPATQPLPTSDTVASTTANVLTNSGIPA